MRDRTRSEASPRLLPIFGSGDDAGPVTCGMPSMVADSLRLSPCSSPVRDRLLAFTPRYNSDKFWSGLSTTGRYIPWSSQSGTFMLVPSSSTQKPCPEVEKCPGFHSTSNVNPIILAIYYSGTFLHPIFDGFVAELIFKPVYNAEDTPSEMSSMPTFSSKDSSHKVPFEICVTPPDIPRTLLHSGITTSPPHCSVGFTLRRLSIRARPLTMTQCLDMDSTLSNDDTRLMQVS